MSGRKGNGNQNGESFVSRWARRKAASTRAADDATAANPATTATTATSDLSSLNVSDRHVALSNPDAARTLGTSPLDTPTAMAPTVPAADVSAAPADASQAISPGAAPEPDADLPPIPPIESLDEHSDYSRFMAGDINRDLRNRALRKLFKAPMFAARDGLDDYDEDYTSFTPLGDVVTSDMNFHRERLAALAREKALESERLAQERLENERLANEQPGDNGPTDEQLTDERSPDQQPAANRETDAIQDPDRREVAKTDGPTASIATGPEISVGDSANTTCTPSITDSDDIPVLASGRSNRPNTSTRKPDAT